MEKGIEITGVKITGLEEIKSQLTRAALTRFPEDMAIALTKTAKFDVIGALWKEMQVVFDRPTPWTLGGMYFLSASPDNLMASVNLKDEWAMKLGSGTPAVKYLWPQIFGGDRNLKRFEMFMLYNNVLPKDMYIVPGKEAPMDQYGNVKHGFITEIMAWFRLAGGVGHGGKTTGERKAKLKRGSAKKQGYEYFVIKRLASKGLKPGIYRRTYFATGTAVKPMLMFVKKPTYRKRFDFFGVGNKAANMMLPLNLAIELNKTIDKINAKQA